MKDSSNTLNKAYFFYTIFLFLNLLCPALSIAQTDSSGYFLSLKTHDTIRLNKLIDYVTDLRYENPELAMKAARKGIQFSKSFSKKEAALWKLLGDIYWHEGQLDSSIVMYDSLRSISLRAGDKAGVSLGEKNMGYSCMEKGNFSEALKHYENSIKIERELNDIRGQAVSNNYVGLIYVKLKDYKRARKVYEECIPMFQQVENFDNLSLIYNNIGGIFIQQDIPDSALTWYFKAYALRDKINQKNLAITSSNIGGAYYYKKNYREAEKYLKEAEAIFVSSNNSIHMADTYYTLSMVYTELKQYDEALKYANSSLELANEMSSFGRMQSVYESLTKIYKSKGDYKKAFEYYEKYVAYSDSLINEEKLKIEKELAEKYDSENKEYKIGFLTAENKLRINETESARKQKNYLIALLAAAVLLGTTLFFFFRNKAKIARELAEKNTIIQENLQEKEVLLKEIHHRVKNNLQIISSLLNLQQGMAGEKDAEEILRISENRIQSMAIIHEKLYQSENLREIDLAEYLNDFMEHLTQSLFLREKNIQIQLHCTGIKLDIDKLVPCSLVLNELVINSVKHGFKGKTEGEITIDCKQQEKNVTIFVSDNGNGLPADFDFNKYQSLGMRLVKGLVKQIKGEIRNVPGEDACFEINFNLA